jgi:hypothetical protein
MSAQGGLQFLSCEGFPGLLKLSEAYVLLKGTSKSRK